MQGYAVVALDQSFKDRLLTVVETINLFQKLGLVIRPDKVKFIPAKIVEYLGFICWFLDSEKMITYLSDLKQQKSYEKFCIISMKPKLKIRRFVSFIGTITFSFLGNQFDTLY